MHPRQIDGCYPWEVNFFGLLCIFLYLKLLNRVYIYVLFGYEKKIQPLVHRYSLVIPALCCLVREN